jgi:hypothetical protein
MQHDQEDYERIDSWLDRPTEIKLTVNRPFKVGFLMGLGFACANLLIIILLGGVGVALSGWLINSFLESSPMQQQQEQLEQQLEQELGQELERP